MREADQVARVYHSGELFHVATSAYESLKKSHPELGDREILGEGTALISVVFAALALEAFINELSELLQSRLDRRKPHETIPDALANCVKRLKECEVDHQRTQQKYLAAIKALTGADADKGNKHFQQLTLLIQIRDAIAHLKPTDVLQGSVEEGLEWNENRILKRLRDKNVLPKERSAAWLSEIQTRSVARWACNIAADSVHWVLAAIPEESLRDMLSLHFGTNFKSVS